MWSDFATWFASAQGERVLGGTVLPAVAILVAGLIAGILARAAVRRVERRLDQDALTAAVAGFVEAARRTATGEPDAESTARLASVSDVRMRLVGRSGADLAAKWAYAVSLRATPDDVGVVRDRLVAWTERPSRAKRLFGDDLESLVTQATVERPPLAEPIVQPARPQPQAEPAPPTGAVPTEVEQDKPAWLDDYDDDAHVTRNIPLGTPSPVAATSVRDRNRPGDSTIAPS